MSKQQEMMAALKEFKEQSEIQCEIIAEYAGLYMVKYKELKKAGFTEDQAMRIICERGLEI